MGLYYLPRQVAFVAREGRGARLWDVDGREYLDFMMGYGPLILGHAHPAVVESVRRATAAGDLVLIPRAEIAKLPSHLRTPIRSMAT
jgi:glutamate-1-semialdehyde 2,1-aminomutase